MYEIPSLSKAQFNSTGHFVGYNLIDGEVITLMSKTMNFKPNFSGNNTHENNFRGSIRAIENGDVDIAGNVRMISDYNTINMVFLSPIDFIGLYYIVPNCVRMSPLNVFIYSMFDEVSQFINIFLFVSLIVIYYMMNFIYSKFDRLHEPNSLSRSFLIVAATQHNISFGFSKILTIHQRLLIICMLFYAVNVSNIYQSGIVRQLSTRSTDSNINTLQELSQSDLNLTYIPSIEDFIKLPSNMSSNIYVKLLYNRQKKSRLSIYDEVQQITINRSSGILVYSLVAKQLRADNYDKKTRQSRIHIVPESPAGYFASFSVPKSSPYLRRFNQILQRCQESGLFGREIEKREAVIDVKDSKYALEAAETKLSPIKLEQLSSLFLVWIVCLVVSSIVLFIEISIERNLRQN